MVFPSGEVWVLSWKAVTYDVPAIPNFSKVRSLKFKMWHCFCNWMWSECKIKNWKWPILIKGYRKQQWKGGWSRFFSKLLRGWHWKAYSAGKLKLSAKMASYKVAFIYMCLHYLTVWRFYSSAFWSVLRWIYAKQH